ncbi:MAG TPA: PKD domain-containing protein [Chitinophagales bacterium]|nr:PKD domain-containing protein [Chitinophagales bacterium]
MRKFLTMLFTALTIAAFGNVHAGFSADKTEGCPPLIVNFTDNSTHTNAITWFWDFDNGNTSSLQNPSAVFLSSGTYHVKLVVSDGVTSDSAYQTIKVFKLPIVDFIVDKPRACTNDTINFISNVIRGDAGIAQYGWGFGNGVASSNINARYLYSDVGIYDITLVVQDSNGCSSNKTRPQYITVLNPPTANFTANPASSCNASSTVSFTNHSSGDALTYAWSLDNGVTSNQANPTHTYNQEVYNVTLLVTDSNGCSSSFSEKISATDVIPDFKASKTTICTGEKVQFTNISNFPGDSWTWNFGDGTVSHSISPIKTYSTPGNYTIKFVEYFGSCADSITKTLYIKVKQGFSVSSASFTATNTNACSGPLTVNFTNTTPGGLTYHWDFGNGDTSNLTNPNETYGLSGNYDVSITVTDANGCTVSGTVNNFVNIAKPNPLLSIDTLGCVGQIVKFRSTSTIAISYLWDFGDGVTSTNPQATHTYGQEGYYTVTFTASNGSGCDTTIVLHNYVHINSPHVDFSVNKTFSPCPPFVAVFSNYSSNNIIKYSWDFGDGYTDTAKNPTHIYFYPGVYTVKMVGATQFGCADTIVYANLITVQGPSGVFHITPTNGCVPMEVSVSANVTTNTKSMWCDMADGTVLQDSAVFVHTYTALGVFHPQFVLTDYVGCTVSFPLDSITTHVPPVLASKDTSVCAGSSLNISLDTAQTYQWSPPDYLSCTNCSAVTINAPTDITYQVKAFNEYGCEVKANLAVHVVALPVMVDSLNLKLCKNDTTSLYVGDAYQLSWSPALYLSDSTATSPYCSPLASVNYTVTGYNKLGCSVQSHVDITVKDRVEVSLVDSANLCKGASVQLNAKVDYASELGVQYSWSPSQYLDNPTIADPKATLPNGPEKIQVIVSSGHCIPDTQTVQVEVLPLPDIEVSEGLTTTPYAEVQLYAASHQDLNYNWYSADSMSCSNCRRPYVYPASTGYVYVEGTNQYGCTIKDSVLIKVQGCDPGSIFMPNTFTPNGDGLNDRFYIRSATLSSLSYFRIYDAWGQLVFETHNQSEGWDGTAFGQPAPIGVYVYELEGTCQNGYKVQKSGNVTAVR